MWGEMDEFFILAENAERCFSGIVIYLMVEIGSVAHFFKPLCKANLKTVAKQSYLWQERNCF
jgi:hypothetical protein